MNLFELVAKLTLDSSEYEEGMQGALGVAGSVGKKVAGMAVKATAAAATAVSAFTASSVKTGMEFDKAMSQVYATMGDKAEQMITQGEYAGKKSSEALRDFAQKMGATTQYTASESAQALNYMALAGYDATTSMEMLPNVMNLAAAGSFDLARASDMLTDTQTALGWSLDRTKQAVDEWAKAASTGNTSVEQMGDAFLTVGGLARELNGGFITLEDGTQKAVDGTQELEIALTAMANAGVKGTEAGTHMRNMLLKLSSPTSEGTKTLEDLGVAVFDDAGQMRSLADIMGDLSGQLGKLTQEEKIQAISNLFNTRDLASAEALLNAVGEDWDAIGASILDSKDAAAEMAATQLDNLAGDITLFKSALDGAKIALSDKLTPALRQFVQLGSGALSEFTEKLTEGDFTGAAESIGIALGKAVAEAVKKVPNFVVAGIALLKGIVKGIVQAIPDAIASLKDALKNTSGGLLEKVLDYVVSFLEKGLPKVVEWLLKAIEGIGSFIISNLGTIIDAGVQILMALLNGIINTIPVLLEHIPIIIAKIVIALIKNVPKLMNAGAHLIVGLIKGIVNAALAIPKAIIRIVKDIKEKFENTDWKAVGKNILKGVAQGILGSIGIIIDAAKSAAKSAFDAAKSFLGIQSPSKLFREKVGKQIGAGMALGIEDSEGVVASAMDDLDSLLTPMEFTPIVEDVGGYNDAASTMVDVLNTPDIVPVNGGNSRFNKPITVILELDRMQLAKAVYRLNNEETQRAGLNLAGGFA